ncbi:TonB-dependent receptor [Janthinobacterium sp. TND4EL3]|uniref:TonB-dependent receptor plug domain-containing protein n=1 Tax=Janthinobacterium sp. TND4EL3 TaxID=1907311 RepID=UPI001482D129|nr:TonB-dependent receptor [Janthinobacterium sp. TND4EL3]
MGIQKFPFLLAHAFIFELAMAGAVHAKQVSADATGIQADTVPVVDIKGGQTDVQARREFIAGKIVIGRASIEASGANNVQELLRKEPAVTISANGRLGLMGLPGYTQVLIDGVAAPAGKEPLELDVTHVESIEIVKSSLAEFGPYGSAGTINIISRKAKRLKTVTQLRLGALAGGSEHGSNFSWSTNRAEAGSPWIFAAQVSAGSQTRSDDSSVSVRRWFDDAPAVVQQVGSTTGWTRTDRLSLGGTVSWEAGRRHVLEFDPGLLWFKVSNRGVESDTWSAPQSRPHMVFSDGGSPLTTLSLPLKWTFRPDRQSKLILRLLSSHYHLTRDNNRLEAYIDAPDQLRQSPRSSHNRGNTIKLDYTRTIGAHDIKTGASVVQSRSSNEFAYLLDGVADASLQVLGNRRDVRDCRFSAFAQDEWRVNKVLGVNLGLSGERRTTDIDEGIYGGSSKFTSWAPSGHVSWKLPGVTERHLRLGLARTLTAPFLDQLTGRPTINPLAPCAPGACGQNSIAYADTAGQPKLRPEKTAGLNLAYEHYIGDDSIITLEAFSRHIDGLIGTDIQLENVPWSALPRYVARPANLGTARSHGLSLEAQLQLRELWKASPDMNLHGSVTLAHSSVSTVPGPDNRLADQSRWSAKFGGSHAVAGLPLKLNVDANWTPSGWVRSTATRKLYTSRRSELSSQAIWTFASGWRAKFTFDHTLSGDATRIESFFAEDADFERRSVRPSRDRFRFDLEAKL